LEKLLYGILWKSYIYISILLTVRGFFVSVLSVQQNGNNKTYATLYNVIMPLKRQGKKLRSAQDFKYNSLYKISILGMNLIL